MFGINYWLYWAKTIGYFIGYIRQKVGDILFKHCWIYLAKLWDILVHWIFKQKLRNILGKIMGYITQKLRDIPWDIFDKN